jgi:signal peptidase II
MFADKSWGIYFLSGVSLVLGVVILLLMFIAARRSMQMISLAFCLLFSGAVGNLIDRIRLRYVIDYLRFDFGDFTFPIFNFADICAVCGTVLLIFIIIFKSRYFEKFWNVLFKSKKNEIILDPEQEKEKNNAD